MKPIILVALGVILGITGSAIATTAEQEHALVERVQSGEITLRCHMKRGMRNIKPGLVVGHFNGVWQFENGQSKSCHLVKR